MDPHAALDLPQAPGWSLFLGQLGKYSVLLALVVFIGAFVLSLMGDKIPKLTLFRRYAFYLGCAGLGVAFISLATLFVTDQFQFKYIFNHSGKVNPISYKIASVWTAQQGSFLLWAVLSAAFGWIAIAKTKSYERWFTSAYALFLGVLAGILAYDSPFTLLEDVVQNGKTLIPPDGSGMVPGLQNYWVIIHPPIVFLGFASLTVPFAYGVAAMLSNSFDDWVKQSRAMTLFGVSVLGLGISLGGLWAYETQGWGGFWGWDPVENVSLVPWLFMVALAHGLIVQSARGIWKSANLLMSGLPFISFVYGTFLTRSGLLDGVSNHSFASMEGTSKAILRDFLIFAVVAFVALYFWRGVKAGAGQKEKGVEEPGVNRTTFYQIGAMSLSLMAFVISLGMSWPVITALRGGQGSAVAPDVYHRSVVWFFAATMVAMAVGPFVSWRREGVKAITSRLVTMISIAMGIAGIFLLLPKVSSLGIKIEPGAMANGILKGSEIPLPYVIGFLLFLCSFVAVTNLWRSIEIAKKSKLGVGSFIAHFGIAVLLSGLIISKGLEKREVTVVSQTEPGAALGYMIKFKSLDPDKLEDRSNVVKFDVTNDKGTHEIDPNMYYTGPNTAQVWPYIERSLSHDVYFFMHKPEFEYWAQPMTIKPGETLVKKAESADDPDIQVQYHEMTRVGNVGQQGTKFGAKLTVTVGSHKYDVNPTLTMTQDGLIPSLEPVSNLRVGLIPGMDVATKSFQVQMYYDSPQFPFEVFYKPLTCLVWIGTGIFTIGGLISAFYRRIVQKAPEGDFKAETATIVNKDENAPLATA